jgi:transposase
MIGFTQLLTALQQSNNVPEIVFEATGVYSRRLRYFLEQHGYRYLQYNPLSAKKEMDSFRAIKTDKVDAVNLALAQYSHEHPMTQLMSPIYTELQDMSRAYQQVNKDIVAHKNQLHKELQKTFPELENVLKSTDSELYWHLVKQFPHSDYVLHHELPVLAETILSSTNKNMSYTRAEGIATRLIDLASIAAPAVNQESFSVQHVRYLADQVELNSTHKNELVKEMKQVAQTLPEYDILVSIPGIADKTACILIGELGDIRRFPTTNKLNAFVGIDLWINESGNHVGKRTITKRGSAIARKTLYKSIGNIASASNENHPCHINDWYQTKIQQLSSSEKTKKRITVGAMHRLLRTIHYLVNNNQMYDYTKATKL